MSAIHGKTGAFYYPAGYLKAITISFTNSPAKIVDSASGLVTAGFVEGQKVVVTGSTQEENNQVYTLGTVAAGNMVVSPAPFTKAAGDTVTVVVAAPGTVGTGFFNWKLTRNVDVPEVTGFAEVGVKAYMVGGSGWTVTAERFFDSAETTASNMALWLGAIKFIRLYQNYVASPSAPNPSYYYEGTAILTSIDKTVADDDVIKETLEFQGIGAIPFLITRTTSWS